MQKFTNLLTILEEQGIKSFSRVLQEEPTEEQFNKEVEIAKKQHEGKIKKKIAAAAVQAVEVRKEETENLDESVKSHIETAYSWHGGMSSPLYSFASTGGKVHSDEHRQNLKKEIDGNIHWVKTEGQKYGKEYAGQEKKLTSLRNHIEKSPIHVKEETELDETVMDSLKHPKFGRVLWANEGGTHVIQTLHTNGKKETHTSGDQKTIAQKWQKLKQHAATFKEDVDTNDILSVIEERALSDEEKGEKERIVKGMKKKMSSFKDRYGDRAKEVMYGTATKLAKEETEQLDEWNAQGHKSTKGQAWLKSLGFTYVGTEKHPKWKHEKTGETVTGWNHHNKEIGAQDARNTRNQVKVHHAKHNLPYKEL